MLLSIPMAAQLDRPVSYVAHDSLVMLGDGTAFLHGKAEMKYEQMELTSEYMRMKLDSSTLYAKGVLDTIEDEWIGKPVFKDGKEEYESSELTYNLKTQKGFIRGVTTEQGEGYILADRTKKHPGDVLTMAGGKYTTCDDHDHPHFYLQMTKAKVKPGSYIATGPAYLVVGDVPLPLAVPFGFFPFTSQYSSGLIMPQFGDDYQRGLYMRGLGYYFAISDYCDLEVTGDIYTKGTWAIQAKSKYVWRYHFNGSFSLSYRTDVTGEKDMPDYAKQTNFSIQWSHSQDSKANPYSTFSASVNYSTSGYNRSNINNYYDIQQNSENTKQSTISYNQRFPNSPFSLSASVSLSQRTRDSTLSLSPELSLTMSSISPFKRKNPVGKEKWYEKIKLNYSSNARIAPQNGGIKEREFLHSDFFRDWQAGMRHTAGLSATFTAFKYLNISPSVSMTDRMYFTRNDYQWNDIEQKLDTNLQKGFYNVFDFNASLSMSTKLYGFFIPSRKLFPHSKVDRFRHVITPSINVNYTPDFGSKLWGYYGSYDRPYTNPEGEISYMHQTYSRYNGAIYGAPSAGRQAAIGFSVDNNLEMKIVNKKDTTGKDPWKVVSLIDNFHIDGGYNFVADSMNWNNFNVSLRIKIPKVNYSINLATTLDPYMYERNALGTPVRTNKQYWHNGKMPNWSGIGTNFSYTFNNQTFQKWFKKKDKTGQDSTIVEVDDGYVKTEIPWSLSVNYSIAYRNSGRVDTTTLMPIKKLTNNLSFSGTIGFGKGWKVSASTSFDFDAKKFTATQFNVSRDLHCWSMSASFVPFGPFKNYTFHIGVNASMLADLKYDKSSTTGSSKPINWW